MAVLRFRSGDMVGLTLRDAKAWLRLELGLGEEARSTAERQWLGEARRWGRYMDMGMDMGWHGAGVGEWGRGVRGGEGGS